MNSLPRTVIALGVVSFFTDFSSEMIYPLLPVFLSTVLGAGALALGVVEGVAESTAALLKVLSGVWTDKISRRKPFIVAGYGLAGLVRPLIGLAQVWPVVLALRFTDRIGKGLRTSPRDALIADVTVPAQRGAAYGLHRAMDHAGAVVGPLAATALMGLAGLPMRTVFLLAAIPAAVVMAVIFLSVKEQPRTDKPAEVQDKPRSTWRDLNAGYRRYLGILLLFTLGNSTDAFLLLRLSYAGVATVWIPTLWAVHHAVKMLAAWLFGRASDRLGYRRMIAVGWIVYALVYFGFAKVNSTAGLVAIFLAYGLYFGLTEPAEKALVSRLVPADLRGTAFGWYHGVIGLGALPASLLFGLLWRSFGAAAAFSLGAGLALTAAALLASLKLEVSKARH
jgi:MFS family permease